MGQLIDLIFDRIIKILVIVTKSEYRNAGAEIQIAFSFCIIEIHAVSPFQDDLITVVGMQKTLLRLADGIFSGHLI